MIGLDTNILVRYLVQDDAIQSRLATEIIEQQLTEESRGFVSLVTLVETVWVLSSTYDLSDRQIVAALELILQASELLVQNQQQAFTAMMALKTGAGSFPDALIGALNEWAGCTETLTFDRKTKRLKHFRQI